MRDAALAYAEMGWRVFPCRPGEKLPLIREWTTKATTDADVIRAWWQRWPDANLAAATGEATGMFVLDIDGPEGEAALIDLERRHGPLPEMYPMQWSGGGGWHCFLSWPEGRTIRNSASKIGRGLDIRGDGGAVMLAPSVHPSGRRYQWADDRSPRMIPPEPAPAWLVDLLDPPERPAVPFRHGVYQRDARGERYVLRALESELAMVAAAPDGRRNDQLNASAHALFRFVAEHRLPADVTMRGLLAAAAHAGLAEREALPTIRSAASARGVSIAA